MIATLDPDVADLLLAVSEALAGVADWRAVAVRVAVDRAWAGTDDPAAAADWLRRFLAERAEATKLAGDLKRAEMGVYERDPQTDWLTAAERDRVRARLVEGA